jgi:protein SCO1/2
LKAWTKPLLVVALAFILAYGGARAYRWQLENKRNLAELAAYTGGDFSLQSADGTVSLSDFEGRIVLIYFGYTYCPDVCPTSLAVMAAAMKQLESKTQVKGLLISFDPERDTVQRLASYAPYFHPDITGLTSSSPRILEVSTRYRVYYKKVGNESEGYLMDHTSLIYVIDQKGKLAAVVNADASPEDVVKRILPLL